MFEIADLVEALEMMFLDVDRVFVMPLARLKYELLTPVMRGSSPTRPKQRTII